MLRERFAAALKEALKARDERRVSTLRLILAALQDRDIAARSNGGGEHGPITDDEILEMLGKMVRQRQESISLYEEAGRIELAQQEAEEIAIIKTFLPSPLSEAETQQAVEAAIDDIDACCAKDIARTIAALKQNYPGRMDFAKASSMVKRRLC